ncbi:DUF397 domain-containing protein [Streptomyces sp. ZEA17I]|nr:DUF397 domain-containing protein [Streptomyces sp. ZEA17I]
MAEGRLPLVEPREDRSWHTSVAGASMTEGPDCVEVVATPGAIHVRDSKHFHGLRLPLTSVA